MTLQERLARKEPDKGRDQYNDLTSTQPEESAHERHSNMPGVDSLSQHQNTDKIKEPAQVSELDLGVFETLDHHISRFRSGAGLKSTSLSNSITSLSLESPAYLSSSPPSPKSVSIKSYCQSSETNIDAVEDIDNGNSNFKSNEQALQYRFPAPHLIMPSIDMPKRRHSTPQGRDLGRLKILFAGASGVGKTSLMRTIAQYSPHVIHVDPPNHKFSAVRSAKSYEEHKTILVTGVESQKITEVCASTRPYPSWWIRSELLGLRKQSGTTGDVVLERNICFVDTPGYDPSIYNSEAMLSVKAYLQSQIHTTFSAVQGIGDNITLLSGGGGAQVDLILYILAEEPQEAELAFMKELSSYSNLVIGISKADISSPEEIESIRRCTLSKLPTLDLFQFPQSGARQSPFTLCSSTSDDDDTMDASVLMSSAYLQPLVPSNLGLLISQIFDRETSACMKHLSATKAVHHWRQSEAAATSEHGCCKRAAIIPEKGDGSSVRPYISSYNQARLLDFTQREEQLAQLRLAKWARDLTRDLATERSRYKDLKQEKRLEWLQLSILENNVTNTLSRPNTGADLEIQQFTKEATPQSDQLQQFDHADDPLGLDRFLILFTRRRWVTLKVIGACSLVGAFAFWLSRNCNVLC